MSATDFSSLKLSPALIQNLVTLDYHEMTPVQAKSLPLILDGKDVIAQAKTGSGKTAVFGLGLLHNLNVKRFRVQSLVLCPTRELADQVAKEIRKLARSIHNIKVLTLCGGKPMGPQIGSLEHGAHIVVGTPGRIVDHIERGRLSLENVNTLVLDEADRMLEMGFQPALDLIYSHCPDKRQTLLFSATFPEQIIPVTKKMMNNPETIIVTSTHDNSIIRQHFYQINNNSQRMNALGIILQKFIPQSAVVFCNTRVETKEVAEELRMQGFNTQALHGDLEQRDRDVTLLKFANKSTSVLVATDVAARGLDIDSLDMVVNYHISHDPEVHVHRIGRTGRAGSKGIACTLITGKESYKIKQLEEVINQSIEVEDLPKLNKLEIVRIKPPMVTLQIDGGKKQKVRPGDILGALTGKDGISGDQVGKINLFDFRAYVAVNRKVANDALKKLTNGKLKGRSFKVRRIS
ncbi:MAG: ATP-dependent RNA helicase DbpA [Gammaproteobacteria bacterium]|nr:ATP-dependent RNA helicase DbpA [Gammaproteobacteria bacterium]